SADRMSFAFCRTAEKSAAGCSAASALPSAQPASCSALDAALSYAAAVSPPPPHAASPARSSSTSIRHIPRLFITEHPFPGLVILLDGRISRQVPLSFRFVTCRSTKKDAPQRVFFLFLLTR